MEPCDVKRSLGVSLSAPNLNLKQETRHYGSLLVLVQTTPKHSRLRDHVAALPRPRLLRRARCGGSDPRCQHDVFQITLTSGSLFRCCEPTCSSSSW